jgi:hypothetical protein
MTRRHLLLVLSFAGLALACNGSGSSLPPVQAVDSVSKPIRFGISDTIPSHAAVVYITINGLGACSGTLISREYVLTAGHCVSDLEGQFISSPSAYKVSFGQGLENFFFSTTAAEVYRHPDYSVSWKGMPINDIAILKIADPPANVSPIPYLPFSLEWALVRGTEVDFSGFGLDEHSQAGQKLHFEEDLGTVCVVESGCGQLAPWTFGYSDVSGGPCKGDSGGPALLEVEGKEYVAGITSYGDEFCRSWGASTIVDRFESFIGPIVGFPNGSACFAPEGCYSGYCAQGMCCDTPCDQADRTCSAGQGALQDGQCTQVCSEPTPCQERGQYDAQAGSCSYALKQDGSPCPVSDSNLLDGTCQGGECVGASESASGCGYGTSRATPVLALLALILFARPRRLQGMRQPASPVS